jgi:hypothetical protein
LPAQELIDHQLRPQSNVKRLVPKPHPDRDRHGVYDLAHNLGSIYVGCAADTPEFAVDSIPPVTAVSAWWRDHGRVRYGEGPELLILADSGGSNCCRSRNWKRQVQEQLADAMGLSVTVSHYPTGASKWNPIEHRLFSEVSKTWAGVPLVSFEVMLKLIEQTQTSTGLQVKAELVEKVYEKGIKTAVERRC